MRQWNIAPPPLPQPPSEAPPATMIRTASKTSSSLSSSSIDTRPPPPPGPPPTRQTTTVIKPRRSKRRKDSRSTALNDDNNNNNNNDDDEALERSLTCSQSIIDSSTCNNDVLRNDDDTPADVECRRLLRENKLIGVKTYAGVWYGEQVSVRLVTPPNNNAVDYQREMIALLRGRSHPRLVHTHAVILADTHVLLVDEPMHDTLHSAVARDERGLLPHVLLPRTRRAWLVDVAAALSFLHTRNVPHGFLNTATVLISSLAHDSRAKLIDWQISKV